MIISCLSACGGDDNPPEAEEGYYTVTFNYNYTGAPSSTYVTVEEEDSVAKPTDPTRDGYTFTNWYTDKDCQAEYNFESEVKSNITLYAGWIAAGQKEVASYTFEAEYTSLKGVTGGGQSSNPAGTDLVKAGSSIGASNGYYVAYLCKQDTTITFKINSDKAVSGVKFTARLGINSVKFVKKDGDAYDFDTSNYLIKVNGVTVNNKTLSVKQGSFQNFEIGNIDLVAGENTIEFITNNAETPLSGVFAVAPDIDYIKLETDDAKLEWTPVETNVK